MVWLWILLGCDTSDEVNWQRNFEVSPQETLTKLALEPPETVAIIGIQLLQNYPESANQICSVIDIEPLKQQCDRFIKRPHLSTIKPKDKYQTWTGGTFDKRLFFPELIYETVTPQCAIDTISCILPAVTNFINAKQPESIPSVCESYSTKRGKGDCYFQASEEWISQYGGYSIPATLCRRSGSYSAECHHHILLALAIRHQSDAVGHQEILAEMNDYWRNHTDYAHQLTQVYWAIVSARVAGVFQPFRWSEWSFLPKSHLHSAIGLRLIRHSEPLVMLEKLLEVEEMRLEKAYGPGTPFFISKQVWSNEAAPQVYFCDIRGGLRPLGESDHQDILLAMVSAAAMLNPPKLELIQEIMTLNPTLFDYSDLILNQ
ncbi:MAG: hypothetical protein ACON4U_08635 [Myxococcota bacterium]